jgi:hypothetical protein
MGPNSGPESKLVSWSDSSERVRRMACANVTALVLCSVALGACGSSKGTEQGDDKGGLTSPAAIVQTSGGGEIQSPNYRATIFLAAPQPMGSADSTEHRAVLGPESMR